MASRLQGSRVWVSIPTFTLICLSCRWFLAPERGIVGHQPGTPWYRMPTAGICHDITEGKSEALKSECSFFDSEPKYDYTGPITQLVAVSLPILYPSHRADDLDQYARSDVMGGIFQGRCSARDKRLGRHNTSGLLRPHTSWICDISNVGPG
jgi:hypothetical protein